MRAGVFGAVALGANPIGRFRRRVGDPVNHVVPCAATAGREPSGHAKDDGAINVVVAFLGLRRSGQKGRACGDGRSGNARQEILSHDGFSPWLIWIVSALTSQIFQSQINFQSYDDFEI